MSNSTFVAISQEAQAPMLAALRRARYGYLLSLHILVLCATGHNPPDIAAVLFCARSRVYRTVGAYRAGALGWEHDAQGRLMSPVRTAVLLPTLRRSLLALLKVPPRADGWCRTRWSCATLALRLQTTRGLAVSAETRRRWLHEIGWVWKRAKLVAKDDDPQWVDRRAHLRFLCEPLPRGEAMVCADALDIHLWPKVGCAGMPQGPQLAVMTPGQHQQHDLAGALALATGTRPHCLGARTTNARFRDWLGLLEAHSPIEPDRRREVVVANFQSQQARAVEPWVAAPPRVTWLWLPTDCPRANPLARAFGDGQDCCTRNHRRQRLPDLGADVEDHVPLNGPWKEQLSDLYDAPAVTAAVEQRSAQEHAKAAA